MFIENWRKEVQKIVAKDLTLNTSFGEFLLLFVKSQSQSSELSLKYLFGEVEPEEFQKVKTKKRGHPEGNEEKDPKYQKT